MVESGVVVPKSSRRFTARFARFSLLILAALSASLLASTAAQAADVTAPRIVSIERQVPSTSPTNADSVTWRFTFDEAVTNVDAADFEVQSTTATVTSVTNTTGNSWDVVVSGGDLASLNANIAIGFDVGQNITDLAGNAYVDAAPSGAYEYDWTIDNTAPQIVSITRLTPSTSPTNADSVTWRLTWSEAVTMGFGSGHFIVGGTTATANLDTAGSSATQDVTISGGNLATLNGTVTIAFSGTPGISDSAGNTAANVVPTGTNDNTFVIDNTAPRLDTISASQTYTNSDSLTFRATFDGAVSNVSADDFAIGGTTATVTGIVVNSSSDYSLTVSGGDLASIDNTTMTIALSGGQDIADAAGNALTDTSPTGYIDEVYVNNTLPVGTFTSAAAAPVAQPFTVNLAFTPQAGFADNILGLTQSDIVVGNGTIESFTFTTAGGGVTTGADIVVRPTADGAVTLDLPENSIFDEAENQNPAATQFSINADVTVPTINIFKAGAPCPCDGPITVTIALSEGGITGFDINDLVVTGGTLSNFSFVNSGSVTLTPTADGTMTLQIPAGSMTDPDGFGNAESNLFSAVFDTTRPTVTLTTAAAAPVTGEFDLDITFSEPLTNVGNTSAWTLTNGSRLSVTGSGANYVMRVRPQSGAQGTLTLDLAENGFSDAAGNGVVAPTQFSIAFDRANPRIASVERFSPSDATTNADSLTFTVTFSEDVSNVDAADFDIYTSDFAPANTTATITNVTPVSASVYRVTVSGGNLGSLNSTTITLNGRTDGNILDAVGNVMSIGSPQTTPEAYTMDNAAPLLNSFARQTPADEQTNADSLVWLVTFSETALNVDAADFDVSGSTAGVSNVSALVAGSAPPGIAVPLANLVSNQYLVTVSGGDLADLDAEVGLDLAPGQNISDSAGNTVANSEPATDETYDVRNSAPLIASITRSTPSASPTNADSLTWRLTFAQIDNAFDLPANAFTVTGTTATVTDVSRFSVGFDVTVSGGDLADLTGDVTLGLTNSDFADDYGNVMDRTIPGGAELTYSVDNTAPSGHSVFFDPSPINAANQAAIGVDFSSFEVGGALTYTVTSSGGAGSLSGGFQVPVASGSFPPQDASALPDGTITLTVIHTDAVGNVADAVTATTTKDTVVPTLAITGPAGPVSGAFTATFTFSEAMVGFDVSEITVGNGAASNLQPVVAAGDGISGPSSNPTAAAYTATITPAANGDVTLDVSAGVATDSVGNANTAATQFSVTNDETAPLLASIARNTPATEQTDADTLVFAITFDESVSNVSADDFDITGTTATGVLAGSGASYTLTLSGGDLTNLNGVVGLDVAAGQDITDLAGNAFAGAEPSTDETYNVLNDTIAPRVASIERYSPTEAVTYRAQLHWQVTFNEDVSELDVTDFAVAGTTGTLSASVRSDHVFVTVAGGDMESLNGVVTLSFAAGQNITDVAGNALNNTVPTGANEASYTVDNTRPLVASIERDTPTTELTNADSLVWAVHFNENVTDIDAADFAVSGTTGVVANVSPLAVGLPPSVAGDGISLPFVVSSSAFLVTASGGDMSTLNGVVTLSFAGNQNIADEAGNLLFDTSPTGANEASFTLDNEAPTLALTTTAIAPVSAPFTLTATFSEDVTGFELGDLVVGNGTASGFQAVSATIYTVSITPGPGPAVTLDVTAGAAVDVAGNDSVAASQLSISHDPDRTLTVSLPGVGSGTVTSAPTGIDCGTDCSEDFALGSSVTLTAAADAGSSFAGWTAGPCTGSSAADCAVTINAETNVAARFTLDTPPAGRIVAATLPGARSGYVGGPVITAFLSVVSRTSSPAQSCQVAAPAGAPVTLTYRQLDGVGMPIGPDSPLFDIDAGGTLSFILAMTATAQTGAGGYSFLPVITCENASLDPIVGVNDVLLNIGAAPTPDLLAVNATLSGDGVIRIPGPGRVQLMTASVLNNGVGDGSGAANEVTLTTTVDTGAAVLPLSLEICQINASAICLTPRSASITSTMTGTDTLFFAVFVRDTSTGGIAFDPANSRVFLRFADATGTIRSTTSAAVTAPAPAAAPEITASLPTGRWSVLMRQPAGVWPGLVRTTLYVMEDGRVLVDDGTAPRLTTMAAATAGSDAEGGFVVHGSIGLWTTDGTIRLGGPWVEQTGEFWGVSDARTNAEARWSDLAGAFGESLLVSETGEIRGTIGGCGVYGQATGFATRAVSLSLSGCAQSGAYLGQIDLPANDNEAPALLIANGSHGWRVER